VSLLVRLALRWSTLAIQREFARFFVVGVAAAVGHYGTLVAAVELGRWPAVPAALAGYLVGGFLAYHLNRRWTFATDRPHLVAVPRFLAVTVVGFFGTALLMALFCEAFGLHYLPAQLVTTGIVMLWSFHANRAWTFAAAPARPGLTPSDEVERGRSCAGG
jgi:putative flippase GtrA